MLELENLQLGWTLVGLTIFDLIQTRTPLQPIAEQLALFGVGTDKKCVTPRVPR
jgi:hypothetical protein